MRFERIIVTWIDPEVEQRTEKKLVELPLNLQAALVVCKTATNSKVFLNEEINSLVERLDVKTVQPVKAGEPVMQHDVVGLNRITLTKRRRNEAFVFILQANQRKFFVLSQRMSRIVGNEEFDLLTVKPGARFASNHRILLFIWICAI